VRFPKTGLGGAEGLLVGVLVPMRSCAEVVEDTSGNPGCWGWGCRRELLLLELLELELECI
jgi:hypothetical protein